MGLQYMICDTDLAKARVKGPKQASLRLDKQPASRRGKMLLILVVLANLALWSVVALSLTDSGASLWCRLAGSEAGARMVTGIMHSEGRPRAIVHGRVVCEGDIIDGYKVVDIRAHEVEFEKDGQRLVERAY